MKNIVNIVTEMVVNKIIESTSIDEASGFDTIFDQF